MPWFKVDDNLAFHPKVVAAGNAAMGLWARAGSWCAQQLTDGFVPANIAHTLGTKAAAQRLVAVRLWVEKDGGYAFWQWDEDGRQPSRVQIEADRHASRERQRVFRDPILRESVRDRDEDRCRYCGRIVHWSDRRGDLGGTYDHVDPRGQTTIGNVVVCCRGCNSRKGRRTPGEAGMVLRDLASDLIGSQIGSGSQTSSEQVSSAPPTRPDPTRPEVPNGTSSRASRARKRAERLPDDWAPDPELVEWQRREGISDDIARRQLPRFRDYWAGIAGEKGRKLDWGATWRNWLRREHDERNGQPAPTNEPSHPW